MNKSTALSPYNRLMSYTRELMEAARRHDMDPMQITVTIPFDYFMESLYEFGRNQLLPSSAVVHHEERQPEFRMNGVLVRRRKPNE